MGAITSHQPLSSLEDSQNDSVCLTPCKRVLYVDPRSPSAGIDRTPIVVQKTPELFDPRSPTPGILRTPITDNSIQGKLAKKGSKQTSTAAVSLSNEKFDGLPSEAGSPETSNDTCHLLGLHKLSLFEDQSPNCEISQLIPANQNLVDTPVIGGKVKPSDRALSKPRAKFGVSTGTRSPLRSRNQGTDSPRNIIQRKQMNSLDNKFTYKTIHSRETTPPTMDKENLTKMP